MLELQCLNCCRKHLGAALGFFGEAISGRYDANFWKGDGQMWLAELHTWETYPEVAKAIEAERLRAEKEENYWPDITKLIDLVTENARKIIEIEDIGLSNTEKENNGVVEINDEDDLNKPLGEY